VSEGPPTLSRGGLGAGYLPGLDGLRAVSVVAVLAYHGGMTWLPGGFLGVEVFFVISGYLITLILTREHERTSTISLPGFWKRRARRLLPSLYLLLVATALVVLVFYREELRGLSGQLWSAASYVTNWFFIFTDQSYFATIERPSILQHLWSLAIEEQFYLLWPIALLGLLKLSGGRRAPVALVAVGLSAASAVLMALLFEPAMDPSRVYYGTDTRASGLLLGAALGLMWRRTKAWREGDEVSVVSLDLIGWTGLGVLVACFVGIQQFDSFLYRGGFVVVVLASSAAIAAAVHPSTVFGQAIGHRLFTWVGVRSYSLYLWHWPIFVFTRPEIDLALPTYPTLVLRLVLTFAAAEVSYRFVEVPIRNGALGRLLARPEGAGFVRRFAAPAGAGALAVSCVLLLVAVTAIGNTPPGGTAQATPSVTVDDTTANPSDDATTGRRDRERRRARDDAKQGGTTTTARTGRTTTTGKNDDEPTRTTTQRRPGMADITVLGDSVLITADEGLAAGFADAGLTSEFRGRPAIMVPAANSDLQAAGKEVASTVIVGLGYNSLWERDRANWDHWSGKFDREADELIKTVKLLGAERIIWVTLREPSESVIPPSAMRQYQAYAWFFPYANERIRALPERHPEVIVVDWAAVSNHEGLTYDTMHLTNDGTALMLSLLKPAIGVA